MLALHVMSQNNLLVRLVYFGFFAVLVLFPVNWEIWKLGLVVGQGYTKEEEEEIAYT